MASNTSDGNGLLPKWLLKTVVATILFMVSNVDAKKVELTKWGRKALKSGGPSV